MTNKAQMVYIFKRPINYAFLLVLFFISARASSQQKEQPGLSNFLTAYSCAYNQQERLFVILNSGFYYPGEIISFKAMLFDANMNAKKDGSQFFYVQLISKTGKSFGNYTFEFNSGQCDGQIKLADSLATGLYTLKAYTKWMRNYGPDNSFKHPFVIISPLNGSEVYSESCDTIPLKFYPESGNLIPGMENKILVRVKPYQSFAINQLKITNEMGQILQNCPIDSTGVGIFSFTPEAGKTYYAQYTDSDQTSISYKLPEATKQGYSLQVKRDMNRIQVDVFTANESKHSGELYLAAISGNPDETVLQPVNLVNNHCNLSVSADRFSKRLIELVLFEGDSIVCSRLYYKKNKSSETCKPLIDDTLSTRELTNLKLDLTTDPSFVSTLVISANEVNPITEHRYFSESSYFLYSDLYSSIADSREMPMFLPNETEEYINNCLILNTHSNILDCIFTPAEKPRYSREIGGLTLSGRVISADTKLPIAGATILMSYPDSVAHFNYCITNDRGEFLFTLNEKLYNRQLYLVAENYPHTKKLVKIEIDNKFETDTVKRLSKRIYPDGFEQFSVSHKNLAMAYRVFYRTKSGTAMPVSLSTNTYKVNFYGTPDFTLSPGDYEAMPNIFEIKKNLIPGLRLEVENDYCNTFVYNSEKQLYYPSQSFVLLNNIPFPSLQNILALNSELIRDIDLKKNKFYYDGYRMHGIMSIFTKELSPVEPYYSYVVATLKMNTEKYEDHELQSNNSPLPDVRHTLYFGNGLSHNKQNTDISFRTSDIKGRYLLKVYYTNNEGKLLYCEKYFTVL